MDAAVSALLYRDAGVAPPQPTVAVHRGPDSGRESGPFRETVAGIPFNHVAFRLELRTADESGHQPSSRLAPWGEGRLESER